jgi:RimJ/RimL family protein N-acetyltransferase
LPSPVTAPVLRTSRLVLRPHRLSDADAWMRIEFDPSVRDGLHWPARDRRAVLAHLRNRIRQTTLWHVGDFLALAVELDGEVIGDVSMHLRTIAPETRFVEIGWLQLPEYSGRGYATEAASAMLDFAFTAVQACWATAVIFADNERSMALAERLGFVRVGRTSSTITYLVTSESHYGHGTPRHGGMAARRFSDTER